MTQVLGYLSDLYDEFMASGDPRVTKWFMMEGPLSVILVVIAYVLCVKVIGPMLMKSRKPFDLRFTMLLYNIGLVVINVYLLYESLHVILTSRNKGLCRRESMNDPGGIRLSELGWWFFFLKLVEFTDTIFFVLRKKDQHISKLHVIHHAVVPIAVWGGLRIEPASYNFFFPMVNTTVHIVMYTYYGLSALGPNVQKYLWWKKYLTTVQMGQFVLVFVYMVLLVLGNCQVSKFVIILNSMLAGLFLVMFYDYFRKTYTKRKSRSKEVQCREDTSSEGHPMNSKKKHTICFNNGVQEPTLEEKKIG